MDDIEKEFQTMLRFAYGTQPLDRAQTNDLRLAFVGGMRVQSVRHCSDEDIREAFMNANEDR